MANSTTLTQLWDRVRSIADQQKSGTSSRLFITDAELTDWLNVEGSELHDILITEFEDLYETTATFDTINGVDEYLLADDFYKLLEVNTCFPNAVNTNQRFTVTRFMNRERNWYWNYPVIQPWAAFKYRIVDVRTMRFVPRPTAAISILYRYAPCYTPLVVSTDTVPNNVQPGWEEYMVLGAASKCLIKEQVLEAAQMLNEKKALIRQRIMTAAADRDANENARVVDTNRWGAGQDGGYYGPYGTGGGWF